MKEALLGRAVRIGSENHLPGECLSARQRMNVDQKRIVDTVELHRFSHGRIDDARMTQDGSRMIADSVDAVELPDLGRLLSREETQTGQNDDAMAHIFHKVNFIRVL